MEYVSAIVPPLVMAIGFGFLVRAIIRSQGGAQKGKEDAAVDAMQRAAAARQPAE
ncbi:hypothetical protein [Kitasatospora sp. GAS204B]|uniref:hypothetical protein n=1 Tax=unclassified Kitasatospora TaxID=2633591 RepID=UPI002473A2E3|nr:hypothetical protein [Kitasatospora sp. GAS204B]MDH6116750.1 hypothetical protein [Kitasatospora sp. GAS204B]